MQGYNMYDKKSFVFGLILSCLPVAASAEQLVLGIIGDADRIAYLEKTLLQPFTKTTGITVAISTFSEQEGADEVTLLQRAISEKWDFLTLNEAQALSLCKTGQLIATGTTQKSQKSLLPELSNMATCHSFNEPRTETIVYNLNAYQRDIPNHISAFFNTERFPGKRAIATEATGLLEMALIAHGVPASQVYHLLSTLRGVELAIDVFASIKSEILWTKDYAEAESLLADGSATMGLIELGATAETEPRARSETAQPLNRLSATASIAQYTSWVPTAAGAGAATTIDQFVDYAKKSDLTIASVRAGMRRDSKWYASVAPTIRSRLDSWSATLQ